MNCPFRSPSRIPWPAVNLLGKDKRMWFCVRKMCISSAPLSFLREFKNKNCMLTCTIKNRRGDSSGVVKDGKFHRGSSFTPSMLQHSMKHSGQSWPVTFASFGQKQWIQMGLISLSQWRDGCIGQNASTLHSSLKK